MSERLVDARAPRTDRDGVSGDASLHAATPPGPSPTPTGTAHVSNTRTAYNPQCQPMDPRGSTHPRIPHKRTKKVDPARGFGRSKAFAPPDALRASRGAPVSWCSSVSGVASSVWTHQLSESPALANCRARNNTCARNWPMCSAEVNSSSAGDGVPVVALQQFLAALRARDFVGAKRLAFRSEHTPSPDLRDPATDLERGPSRSPHRRTRQQSCAAVHPCYRF